MRGAGAGEHGSGVSMGCRRLFWKVPVTRDFKVDERGVEDS